MDPSGPLALGAFVSLLFSALLQILERALASFSPSRLEKLLGDESQERLERRIARVEPTLLAVIALKTLANVGFVLCVHFLVYHQMEHSWPGLVLGVLSSTLGLLLLAKIVPQVWSHDRTERILARFLRLVELLDSATRWISWPLTLFKRLVSRILRTDARADLQEDILVAVADREREGAIRMEEKEMIRGILDLKGEDVSEIMTPRTDMITVEVSTPLDEAVRIALEKGHSRLPIYKENRDRIVGILNVKDVLSSWSAPDRSGLTIERLLRKPFFVPETKHIGQLLREFQEQKVHIAVVLDEYGGTAGLITIEDIIEQIVGEIEDEYDPDREPPFKRLGASMAEVAARCHLDDFNEMMGLDLPRGEGYDTVGGFIFTEIGKIPRAGEIVEYNGIRFTVLAADERRIHRVKVEVFDESDRGGHPEGPAAG